MSRWVVRQSTPIAHRAILRPARRVVLCCHSRCLDANFSVLLPIVPRTVRLHDVRVVYFAPAMRTKTIERMNHKLKSPWVTFLSSTRGVVSSTKSATHGFSLSFKSTVIREEIYTSSSAPSRNRHREKSCTMVMGRSGSRLNFQRSAASIFLSRIKPISLPCW